MNVLILHDALPAHAAPDVQDNFIEAQAVAEAAQTLGNTVSLLPVSGNLAELENELYKHRSDVIINLVESLNGSGRWAYQVPALLEKLRLPFTGAKSLAIQITTDKLRTKKLLDEHGIPTPYYICTAQNSEKFPSGNYIIKPVWEDASVGINADAVVYISGDEDLPEKIKGGDAGEWFAETYIDGEEWNLSLLENKNGLEILPPAEICFNNWQSGKPKILDYRSKWEPDSVEFQNTSRNYNIGPHNENYVQQMKNIAERCWSVFNLSGYARIDYRVSDGAPYVLEINANPCISPDAGLAAAAAQKGISYPQLIEKIIHAATF